MIQIKSKLDCCGCTACASSCPKSAITMVPDEEGFLYPKIDMRRCIECGACERACPILNKKTVISEKTEGYIIRIKDNKILYESTSGGAFTALADYILEQNGIVYGAGYDNNMRVVCKRATTKQQLQEMRGSKFVQSDLGNIFQDIKKELKEGTTILFSGTPCQVAGLLSFLRKKPDNLLCVDFVCRGVPSPGLWDNYVKYMENKYSSKIVGARFKHKTYGYHTSTMKIDFANGKTYYGSGRVDPYMKAFVREISSRPSCAACAFKGIERPTDSDISVCGVDRIFEKKQEKKKKYHCNYEEITVDQAIEWLLLGQKIESGAWNKLFKASTIEDVHFEEGKKINEDKYFVFRSLLKSKKIVYCAEKLYYYYCRENSVTNQSFSERWFDSLYFADRIYEELKGRNNLEVFARYQLLIAYYTVLRRMYPFRNQYKKEYQLVIDKIKSTSFKSVLSYMDKKQVFGVLSIKYCILLYKFMRCVSK